MSEVSDWIAQHAHVGAGVVWHGADGRVAYQAWDPRMRAALDEELARAAGGAASDVPDPPHNLAELADDAPLQTIVTGTYAWRLYVENLARSLFVELRRRVPWSVTTYEPAALAVLFDSDDLLHRRGDGRYEVDVVRAGKVTPSPPSITARFLERQGLVGADPLDTIGRTLLWCRDHLSHGDHAGGAPGTARGAAALWQYRGWAPVSRMISGTRGPDDATARHYTVGCWGTTGLLRCVLRAVNVPVTQSFSRPDAPRSGHSLTAFPTVARYLS